MNKIKTMSSKGPFTLRMAQYDNEQCRTAQYSNVLIELVLNYDRVHTMHGIVEVRNRVVLNRIHEHDGQPDRWTDTQMDTARWYRPHVGLCIKLRGKSHAKICQKMGVILWCILRRDAIDMGRSRRVVCIGVYRGPGRNGKCSI